MKTAATITSKGQITVPESIRDFLGVLIAVKAESADAGPTYTFDKRAAKLPGFILLA